VVVRPVVLAAGTTRGSGRATGTRLSPGSDLSASADAADV
jgi:hypothetical protein